MIRKLSRAIAGVSLVAMTSACATVTRGTHEGFTVMSEPPGAVTTTNGFSCEQTPCTFKMMHKADFDITISRPGYKPFHAHVDHDMAESGGLALAGNAIIGGIPGAVVDIIDGATMQLRPNPLSVRLEPEGGSQAADQRAGESTIVYR